jgi:DNA-binding winged helix-turn-helix (wHTH) protein/tetratricopeptide (TPR) repeat protein
MSSYRFHEFELIPETRRLTHRGVDVAVGVRVLEVVIYLVEHRARAVGRDELLSAVWGRADGGDATLAQAVLKARRALGDDGNAQNFIRTVARFGYQWVAPTSEAAAGASREVAHVSAPSAADPVIAPTPHVATASIDRSDAPVPRSRRARFAFAAIAALVVVAIAFGIFRATRTPPPKSVETAVTHATSDTVPGLILVAPARVHSLAPDDGWMRLGVMSLATQSLANVPGHAVVPDETTLAAVAHAGADASAEALRAATGASVVIVCEADRVGEDWRLDATVLNADGSAQIVSARAGDPVAAASSLARNLRDLLAPEGTGDASEPMPPDVLALAAHMKAAILEAQNSRAITLLAAAPKAVADAPQIVLLQAEALTQLGRPADAIAALRPLVDRAAVTQTPPRWLPGAWTALGDAELARGQPAQADAYFRRAIQLEAVADRRSLGMAWRGLGIAQVVRNDLDGAEQSYLRARLELEPVGDRLLLARVTDGLGYIATTRGRVADALMLYEQAAAMGAAAGLNETELGSRLNVAQAHHYLLHHAIALEKLRALLPRVRAIDYPALHTFGSIAYANALIETGAFDEARAELARWQVAKSPDAATDAVVDVRLDEAGIRLALGDADAAIRLADAVRREHDIANAPDRHLGALALLLNAHLAAGHREEAAALARDASAWAIASAGPPARVDALVAQARWAAAHGDAASALDHYRQALAIAREFGTPLVLRDAAVPYATFQLDAGAVDVARQTASVVGPYAEDDFEVALLMARVAAATNDADLARAYFGKAHKLAGQRWTPSLADEEARLAASGRGPAPQTVAGG